MNKAQDGTYVLSKDELTELLMSQEFLELLYCHGIDNWDGYYEATNEFRSRTEEINKMIDDIK